MNNNIDIVKDALEYYDANEMIYSNKFNDVKYLKFENSENDIEHNKIIMFDKDKKQLYKLKYEIIGSLISDTNIWMWGWSMPSFTKNMTTTIRKIINYGMELDTSQVFLKTELITSRFRITDPIQIEVHTAIASYLSKKPVIFSFINYKTDKDNFIVTFKSNDNDNSAIRYYLFILDM